LRIGNEKGEDEADTVGCTSLRAEHIKIEEDNKITLDFLGKDSMRYLNTVDVDPRAHKALKTFLSGKQPKEDLFDKIKAADLNEYLKGMSPTVPDLSAKVFRTYNASKTLQDELTTQEEEKGNNSNVDDKVKFYENANRQVAILCNH